MKRRIIALLIPATFAALASCGDSGTTSPATDYPGQPSAPPTNATAVEPTTDELTPVEPTTDEATIDEPVVVEAPGEVRSITVGGMGAEFAPPTRCTVDLAVNVQRPSVREATAGASAAADSLVAALGEAGVPESAIQSSELWIHPVHDQHQYRLVVGYEVTMGYRVTVADVADVGSVLDRAIAAGGDSIRAHGVRFEGDPAGLMDAARAAAWADVQARAESTAELVNEPLGRVLDAHEKVLVTSPQGMMQGGQGDSASFDIPVSPGLTGVTVLLTVTYEIGD